MARSNRENFIRVFQGETTDKILWVPDLTWWRDSQLKKGTLPPEYRGGYGFLKLHTDLGVMPYYIYSLEEKKHDAKSVSVHQIGGEGRPYNGVWGLEFENLAVEESRKGNILKTVFKINGKKLVQRKQYLPESYCYAFLEYPVKTIDDIDVLSEIIQGYRYYSTEEDYICLEDQWGDFGLPISTLPRSPLSALIVDWIGLENFIFMYADYPDKIRTILHEIDDANSAAFKLITQSKSTIFHFCDNLSASNYTPYFDELASEYYTRRVDELHRSGKKCIVHLDGYISGLIDKLAATGLDAIEALTTKPAGDVDIRELRGKAGNENVILWGCLPSVIFTPKYAAEDFERIVADFIQIHKTDPRMIAGSADQISPDAELERIARVSELFYEQNTV